MKRIVILPLSALMLAVAAGVLLAATTSKIVAVSAVKLEALLPHKIDGFSRITAKSQCCGIPGMVESYATGVYRGRAGAAFKLKLTDMGKPAYSFAQLGQIYLINGSKMIDSYRASKNVADSAKAFDRSVTTLRYRFSPSS